MFPTIDQSLWIIFDSDYCTDYNESPHFKGIKTEWYEKFRDLSKVVDSRLCLDLSIGIEDCLMIDSENKKIQGYLNNSLRSSAFDEHDLFMQMHP